MLSFMDTYYGYNHIKMDPVDAQKIIFISNDDNYYYNVMPFGLKNIRATCQMLMVIVLSKQIGHNQ